MLRAGRERLNNEGLLLPNALADAEKLPFASNAFDLVTVAFGLRNMTHWDVAIAEMTRVLKPGGRLMIVEFSKVHPSLSSAYDAYSFNILPWLGKVVARTRQVIATWQNRFACIRIRTPLKSMMEAAGLARTEYFNLTAGVVAVHKGSNLRCKSMLLRRGPLFNRCSIGKLP